MLALMAASPAAAQIEDDFAEANRIFGQVSADSVVEDIEGEWLPLSVLSNAQGTDPDPGLINSLIERICGNDPVRGALMTALDGTSFEMVAANSGGELVYRFDWIAGSQFHRNVDPEALFRVFKFDTMEGENGVAMRARALEQNSSRVDLFRVSPDLLAMVTPGRAELFGRCPE
ncbi:hypothetical protein VE26_10520 [Devosia chinhatensis]|uniref:Uncharacterized protein n=2 Tax=Devosia chinhatensis TaxID=429727 RepID=A0A0F5FEA1_9HYPH|nr:hypothetical protein VE26_10520 [Devosia chinhatensis]